MHFFIKSNSKKIKCESWIEKVVNQRCPPGSTLSRMDSGLYQTQTIPDSAQLDYELYQTALNIDLMLSRTAISLTLRYPWQRLSLTRQYPGQNLAWLIGVPDSAQLYSMLSQTAFSWTQRYPGQRLARLSAVLLLLVIWGRRPIIQLGWARNSRYTVPLNVFFASTWGRGRGWSGTQWGQHSELRQTSARP